MRDATTIDAPRWARDLGLHGAEVAAADGTMLRFWVGGAPEGARAILLHGWPQSSLAWHAVAERLVGEMRLVIPDLRGYGASDVAASGRYDLDTLVGDVVALEGATRREGERPGQALLVAHDWGGPIAWHTLHTRPELVRGLVATNAPHFAAYARELRSPDQAKRAWYTGVFQIPGVEHLLTLGDGRAFRFVYEKSAPPGLFSEAQVDAFVRPLLRPGRARASIAYYRAAARYLASHRTEIRDLAPTPVPATIVWGQNDAALSRAHPDACRRFVTHLEIRRLDGVSHWVPEQAPDAVAQAARDLDAQTR